MLSCLRSRSARAPDGGRGPSETVPCTLYPSREEIGVVEPAPDALPSTLYPAAPAASAAAVPTDAPRTPLSASTLSRPAAAVPTDALCTPLSASTLSKATAAATAADWAVAAEWTALCRPPASPTTCASMAPSVSRPAAAAAVVALAVQSIGDGPASDGGGCSNCRLGDDRNDDDDEGRLRALVSGVCSRNGRAVRDGSRVGHDCRWRGSKCLLRLI